MKYPEEIIKMRETVESLWIQKTELEEEIIRINKEIRKKASSLEPKPKYKFGVELSEFNGREALRITMELENKDEIEEFKSFFGIYNHSYEERAVSVLYFRINGVLLYGYGGRLTLKEYALVSDEEWEQIKEGNIPAHLFWKS